ncbi:DUF2577 family protein [Peptostreptococcus canis]|uniref:DUF2577 family protein n=1 Tax=Peptostreptococcus canis TaxID=1159213 RepID=A0ABR6TMD7_9FIRM|nr:DUF2577 family protein [Peptostreptococcus canis]MBC2576585.1 DUF2577 family protein [Peptostreptococcus canis]MBP1998772.1 magnesium-transporting ATPase (P-type) [Peptostreptococcus canis]
MNGYKDFKKAIQKLIIDESHKYIFLAKVEKVNPLILNSDFIGKVGEEQLSILENTKTNIDGYKTEITDKHNHSIQAKKLKVGDIVLLLLYQQEVEQKFIIIDKVVNV